MKRSDPTPGLQAGNKSYFYTLSGKILLMFAVMLLSGSCEKGYDGEPGMAFVSFIWTQDEPDYVENDNEFIPVTFVWDWYYPAAPGLYHTYYEGVHSSGGQLYEYAWELEYEVWENPGTSGRLFEDGENGPDAYFTVECNPYGPDTYYEEAYPEKSASGNESNDTLINNGDEIVIEKSDKNFNMRLTYKKVATGN